MTEDLEPQYGLFAYEDDLRDPEELENPETKILGEENDLQQHGRSNSTSHKA